jgi:hypothetical protein
MTNSWTGIVVRPTLKLQDVRHEWQGNECYGRGRGTAAPRGYNAELLAKSLIGEHRLFYKNAPESWFDNCVSHPSGVRCYIEVKTAITQYPSGGDGRFRIWSKHHSGLTAGAEVYDETRRLYVYLFLVYRVKSGIEREIGKVVVPAEQVDRQIDSWNFIDHDSMDDCLTWHISWRDLIRSLGVTLDEFRSQPTVDLTEGSEQLQRAQSNTGPLGWS